LGVRRADETTFSAVAVVTNPFLPSRDHVLEFPAKNSDVVLTTRVGTIDRYNCRHVDREGNLVGEAGSAKLVREKLSVEATGLLDGTVSPIDGEDEDRIVLVTVSPSPTNLVVNKNENGKS
jgi:hypothetical protein